MTSTQESPHAPTVSILRLNLLRALYLLVVVGLGATQWPTLVSKAFQPSSTWVLMDGVVVTMLASFSALALLGLKYPLKMIPVLFWELGWKILWILVVAVPLLTNGDMDEAHVEVFTSCLLVVVFPFLMPWRYIYGTYIKAPGDRWRS